MEEQKQGKKGEVSRRGFITGAGSAVLGADVAADELAAFGRISGRSAAAEKSWS